MPQMDSTIYLHIFETLMVTFILGYLFTSTYLLLPFINAMKIRYELKARLLFINYLVIKKIRLLSSFKTLQSIKIRF